MSKHLAKDLERSRHLLLRMAAAVEESIYLASQALQTRNAVLARKVIEGDQIIDRFENEVKEECLKLLALHQPVAGDLRHVTMMFRICTDLERIGDLAVGIAERAEALIPSPIPLITVPIARMSRRAIAMVRKCLDAFVAGDADSAKAVIRMDDEVDQDNVLIIKDVLAAMKQRPEWIDAGLSLFSAVRHLERIADHATNIAEDIVYLIEGEIVRHHP